MTWKEKAEKARGLLGEAKSIRDKAQGEKRVLTPEEEKRIDGLMDDGEKIRGEAEAEKAAEEKGAKRSERLDKLLAADEKLNRQVPHADTSTGAEAVREPETKEQKTLRKKALRLYAKGGWDAVREGGPEFVKSLSSLRDPEGGFTTAVEEERELIKKIRDLVQIRQRATVRTTSKAVVRATTFDYEGDAELTGESGTIAEENITDAFGKVTFTPHKRGRILRVPNELLDDSEYDLEGDLQDHMTTRFAEIEENDFINGNGVKRPLGIVTALGLAGASARNIDSGGTTDALKAEDPIDTVYHLKKQYRMMPSLAWLMNRTTIKKARKLRSDSGAGAGTGDFLWEPSLKAGEPDRLLNYAVMESEFLANPAADGDPHWILGAWTYYRIYDRTPITVQRLIEKYAEVDEIGLLMKWRVDAGPVLADAFVRMNRN